MPRKRILIVDDSPTQLEALRSLLEAAGFDVVRARRGEEAIEIARAEHVDLVLSDVMMPGISGYEMCGRLKAGLPDAPPVVLLTSLSDPRDIVRGLECGADSYVTKPYETDLLLERVRRVLENRELLLRTGQRDTVPVRFLGELYTIRADAPRILELLLSSFEDLIRSNQALAESERAIAEAAAREVQREQAARARAEEDARHMEALKQDAERAMRARDELLAAVSHDLRNPLGTIYTSAALLLDVELSKAAMRRQTEIIRRTAESMNRLIQDLLDVSRMESGYFAVEPQPENALSLLAEAREQFTGMAEELGIALEVTGGAGAAVLADRGRALQVISNLVGNALKFTPRGGRVDLAMAREESGVRFTVRDTGPGIPAEDLPRIFDRFWQGGGAASGAGLGLAIARSIVDAHGGRIWAESAGSGGGTAFHLTLPAPPPDPLIESG
jgi:two-component system, sensor histidine kinase and response regulator